MSNVTISVDIAKNVFEIAVSAAAGRIQERRRMTVAVGAERASSSVSSSRSRRSKV